ncbi:MAG: UDP-N-acetylmuramoyl-tripeptide--D-alanyl-D-alanine ligase [Microgenomates group bacterium]
MEKINPFSYFYYHLYLLQLEEYDIRRFLHLIQINVTPVKILRKQLVWTQKITLIATLTVALILVLSYFLSPLFLLLFYVSALPISFIVFLLLPLDRYMKHELIKRAKLKLATFPNLEIVGIAGSYGKTTMKEVVSTILSEKYVVLKTPENVNTPLGIAHLILNKLDSTIQVLVVEMGEYTRGDIQDICSLVKPQTAIITGINEAHLERMGTLENTTSAIFELAQHMDQKGLLVLNEDNVLVRENYHKYYTAQKIELVSVKKELTLESGLLGRYAKAVLQAGAAVGRYLGLTDEQIKMGASKVCPLPHRLQPIEGTRGVLVIDDSYNGNPEGVSEAIYLLSTYTGRRKVFITPGLVETGGKNESVHKKIGKELASVADRVVLIKNSATPFIAEGLMEHGFDKKHIIWFKTAREAHAAMGEIIEQNDVVLFQNDWPDNYR